MLSSPCRHHHWRGRRPAGGEEAWRDTPRVRPVRVVGGAAAGGVGVGVGVGGQAAVAIMVAVTLPMAVPELILVLLLLPVLRAAA